VPLVGSAVCSGRSTTLDSDGRAEDPALRLFALIMGKHARRAGVSHAKALDQRNVVVALPK
jgi:hypothetical protein